MVAEKTMNFKGKNKDLDKLSNDIVAQLDSEGYTTKLTSAPAGTIIQAQKAGILRDLITADRAFVIAISGKPNDFTIRLGIGKFMQNLGVTAVEALLVSGLFLVVDVPEMLWTTEVEKGVVKEITDIVNKNEATNVVNKKK